MNIDDNQELFLPETALQPFVLIAEQMRTRVSGSRPAAVGRGAEFWIMLNVIA